MLWRMAIFRIGDIWTQIQAAPHVQTPKLPVRASLKERVCKKLGRQRSIWIDLWDAMTRLNLQFVCCSSHTATGEDWLITSTSISSQEQQLPLFHRQRRPMLYWIKQLAASPYLSSICRDQYFQYGSSRLVRPGMCTVHLCLLHFHWRTLIICMCGCLKALQHEI